MTPWDLVGLPLDPLGPFTNAHLISRTYLVQFGLVVIAFVMLKVLHYPISISQVCLTVVIVSILFFGFFVIAFL